MAKKRLEYVDPHPISRTQALALLAAGGNDTADLQRALVALALHDRELIPTYDLIVRAARDTRPQVRATAILCVGHLARIHKVLPDDQAVEIVNAGLMDENEVVRGQSISAADDLELFLPPLGLRIRRP